MTSETLKDMERLDAKIARAVDMCLDVVGDDEGPYTVCSCCGAIMDDTDESEEHDEYCPVSVLAALRARLPEPPHV